MCNCSVLVVARHNEDAAWLRDLQMPVMVMDKAAGKFGYVPPILPSVAQMRAQQFVSGGSGQGGRGMAPYRLHPGGR